jgi:AcrR family transcriptional regulator
MRSKARRTCSNGTTGRLEGTGATVANVAADPQPSPIVVDASGPASRLERRKARTRAAILGAAEALFRDHGFEPTSMQQIAERATTGVGTLYGYFASKDDVLRAVIRESSDEAVASYLARATDEMSATDRFMLALDVFATYIQAHRPILQAAFRLGGARADPPDPARGPETPGWWVFAAFRDLIRVGVEKGEFRDVPVDTVARVIVTNYLLAILGLGLWEGHGDDPNLIGELRALVKTILTYV